MFTEPNVYGTNYPLAQITPFTYREGATLLSIVNSLVKWVKADLLVALKEENDGVRNFVIGKLAQIDEIVEGYHSEIDTAKDEWDARHNLLMSSLTETIGELNDVAVSQLIQNPETVTGSALMARENRRVGLNALDFGAKGDNLADDTVALQAALDAAGSGGTLNVPAGKYRTETLQVPSDITVNFMPGAELVRIGGNFILNIEGTEIDDIPILADIANHTASVTTTRAHGRQAGDVVAIVGQRDSLSNDATEDWRLGYATSAGSPCYFGEFALVRSVSGNTLTLAKALVFEDYKANKANDSAPTARDSTTVFTFSPARRVRINGGIFSGAYATAINVRYGHDVIISGVEFRSTSDRPSVQFVRSYACEARNCRTYYPVTVSESLFARNAFKGISAQSCKFIDCYVENGSQCFDYTYSTGFIPSMSSTIENCSTFNAQNNAATSHGGSYEIAFIGNNFSMCARSGVTIRSRNSVFSGNTVTGCNESNTVYGVQVYEGWAQDCTISANTIAGFGKAVIVQDAPEQGEKFLRIGVLVSGNTITNCHTGFEYVQSSTNLYRGVSGINIVGNSMSRFRFGGYAIYLGGNVQFAKIANNYLDGGNGSQGSSGNKGLRAIHLAAGTNATTIDFNTIIRWAGHGILFYGDTTQTVPNPRTYVYGNVFVEIGATIENNYQLRDNAEWWYYSFSGTRQNLNRQTVTGSKGGNAALDSLISQLSWIGLISNETD